MSTRVLLTGGGTAGHLFPAIAVGEQLAEADANVEILLVAAVSDRDNTILAQSNLPAAFICARPFPYGFCWQIVPSVAGLLHGLIQALGLLRRFRPTVIFGTGGYVAAPVIMAARLLGIPRVVHIGDAYPDRTGRLLSRGAQLVTLAFASAAQYLPGRRTQHIGAPVRKQILTASRAEGQELLRLAPDRFTVLVTGGSQGARSLNEALLAALPVLLSAPDLQIIHLTGRRGYEAVKAQAETLGAAPPIYHCLAYLEQMGAVLAAADLVVSRAGSSSTGEATALGKPLVLVPYPYAAGHQKYNAAELEAAGAALVIPDEQLSGVKLAEVVLGLYRDKERRRRMAQASAAWGRPEAAQHIARILMEVERIGPTPLSA